MTVSQLCAELRKGDAGLGLHKAPWKHERCEWGDIVIDAKAFFEKDLLGFLDQKRPRFRAVTSGGYGLKTLLDVKYGMRDVIATSDIDITISVKNASYTPLEALTYWRRRVNEFIGSRPDKYDFKVVVTSFRKTYVPVMNYNRFFYIGISYKGKDFMDFAITDYPVYGALLDIGSSRASQLPLKTEEGYLKEFLTLLYMETVPNVMQYAYTMRNPITGKTAEKGRKDLERVKLLCDVKKQKHYKKYCALIRNVTVSKLRKMTSEARDTYFESLRDIFPIYRKSQSQVVLRDA